MSISQAFQSIFAHKLRSFLTMLGIIIGIGALITIVATIQGTNEQIKENLIGAGNNVITIELYQNDMQYDMSYQNKPDGVTVAYSLHFPKTLLQQSTRLAQSLH